MRAVLLVLLLAALAVASVPIDRSIDSGDEYSELRDLETVELDRMDHRGVSGEQPRPTVPARDAAER